jgi:pimeloyl-ACP methyl ester carboxylesterase
VACLEREIDALTLREWPGLRGPLVCLSDPLGSLSGLPSAFGNQLAPEWRVFSLAPRPELPYQAQAAELLRVLDTFGFERSVLLGSGLGGGIALLIAAWYPKRVAGLVLVNNHALTTGRRRKIAALAADQPAWRAWLDAPPAWKRLESRVVCPVLRARTRAVRRVLDDTRAFLQALPSAWRVPGG